MSAALFTKFLQSNETEPDDPGRPLTESELNALIAQINSSTTLQKKKRPVIPTFSSQADPIARVRAIQKFCESFEYNYTGTNFFDITGVRDNTTVTKVLDISRRIIADALPIKCVEATYLALALTQAMHDIVRIPLIMYSSIDGHKYGHIVMAVRVEGKYGAMGLSRRSNLMYKEPLYDSMFALLVEFRESYAKWGHRIVKIKLGPAIPHEGDMMVNSVIAWSKFLMKVKKSGWEAVQEEVGKYMRGCLRHVQNASPMKIPMRTVGAVANVQQIKRQRLLKGEGKGDGEDSESEGVDGDKGAAGARRRDEDNEMISPVRVRTGHSTAAAPRRPTFLGV